MAKCDPGPRPRVCNVSSFDQIGCPGWKERQMRTLVLNDLGQLLPVSACSPGGTRTLMGTSALPSLTSELNSIDIPVFQNTRNDRCSGRQEPWGTYYKKRVL